MRTRPEPPAPPEVLLGAPPAPPPPDPLFVLPGVPSPLLNAEPGPAPAYGSELPVGLVQPCPPAPASPPFPVPAPPPAATQYFPLDPGYPKPDADWGFWNMPGI